MKKTLLIAALLTSFGGLASGQTAGPFDYDMCGTIVSGVTCPLFLEDTNGDLWLLEDYGGYGLGDFVHVIGTADPGCITICIQGEGCVFGNTIAPCGSIGLDYCFCDPIAPCGNTDPAAGCANSSGSGATIEANGSASVGADDLTFQGVNLLPNQPALLFAGLDAINNGDGTLFGDGLRCAGNGVVRLGTQVPDANGGVNYGPGLGAQGGWSAGDTRRFQIWYRDPSMGPCGSGFNLTHGTELTFVL